MSGQIEEDVPIEKSTASNLLRNDKRFAVVAAQELVGFGVVGEGFRLWIEDQLAARAVRDVREVAERRGKVPLFDFAVQILALARAHAVDEVLEMADFGFLEIGDLGAGQVVHLGEAQI